MKMHDIVRYHNGEIGMILSVSIPQHMQKPFVIVLTSAGKKRWDYDWCVVISESR